MSKERILSGMRATNSRLHLGNYEGALKPLASLQDKYDMFVFVADWHSYTTMGEDAGDIGAQSISIAKDYIAGGLDPSKTALFLQSDVVEHAELHLAFSMVVGVGKLRRNPTWKGHIDDHGGNEEGLSYGLLGYPVLQAADILLYKPYGVPVGKDQAPHLELSREIGRSFNARFGNVFPEFKSIINEDTTYSAVPGLDMRKMSKSYDNGIYLNDTPEQTAIRIKGAFTTPTKIKKTDPGIPEGCAVCQFLKMYHPDWQRLWAEDVAGERGCMQNKTELTDVINEYLRPFRDKRATISDDDVRDVLKEGAKKARLVASATMEEVRRAMKLG